MCRYLCSYMCTYIRHLQGWQHKFCNLSCQPCKCKCLYYAQLTLLLSHIYRTWQNIALVHDSNHKVELYKYLWMLMGADSTDIFQDLLQKFLKTWEQTEP